MEHLIVLLLHWEYIAGAAVTVLIVYGVLSLMLKTIKQSDGYGIKKNANVALSARSAAPPVMSPMDWKPELKIEKVDSADRKGTDFFEQRQRQKNLQNNLEQQLNQIAEQRDDSVDQELSSWVSAEEKRAEQRRAQDEAMRQAMLAPTAVDKTLAKSIDSWADDAQIDVWQQGKPRTQAVAKAHKAITQAAADIAQEAQDLEHVVDKLETSVDFISLEYRDTVDKWKKGEAHRLASLDDLKNKFRLKTFSLEDAWELVFSYPEWLAKTRKQLYGYVGLLGVQPQQGETLGALIKRAEKIQWGDNDLDINMDVIFLLKEIRKMAQTLQVMQKRLKALEQACQRRSNQVIAPTWEVQNRGTSAR